MAKLSNLSASTAWNIKPVALSCGIICHVRASYHSLSYSFNESSRWETDKPVSFIADLWRMHLGISHDHSLLDWWTNCNSKELQRLRYTFDITLGVEHCCFAYEYGLLLCLLQSYSSLYMYVHLVLITRNTFFRAYIYIYVSNNTWNLGAHIYHRWVTNVKLTSLFISVSQIVTTREKWTNLQRGWFVLHDDISWRFCWYMISFYPTKNKGHTIWWKYRNMYIHMPYESFFATKFLNSKLIVRSDYITANMEFALNQSYFTWVQQFVHCVIKMYWVQIKCYPDTMSTCFIEYIFSQCNRLLSDIFQPFTVCMLHNYDKLQSQSP